MHFFSTNMENKFGRQWKSAKTPRESREIREENSHVYGALLHVLFADLIEFAFVRRSQLVSTFITLGSPSRRVITDQLPRFKVAATFLRNERISSGLGIKRDAGY